MFFAFAALNPDMQFLLYFVIPIKVKWLALLDAAYMLYQVVQSFYYGIIYFRAGQSTGGGAIQWGSDISRYRQTFSYSFLAQEIIGEFRLRIYTDEEALTKSECNWKAGPRHRCAVSEEQSLMMKISFQILLKM